MVTNQSRRHTINHVLTDAPTHPRTHEHIHDAIHPPTMCYSCARTNDVKQEMCFEFVRSAPASCGPSTTGLEKRKLQNTSTTHTHERVRTPTLPHTDRITNPHAPSVPPTTWCNNTAVRTAAHGLVHAISISVSCWDFHYFTILHPGE